MTKSSTFAKGALAAMAGVVALGAAATAAAQSAPPPPPPGNYDPCQREASNRAVTGGFLGAAGGAVLGSQFAANGHRRDGSLLGGVIGAIAGASIGHSTAACGTAPPPPPQYDQGPPPPPPPGPQAYYQPEPPPPPAYAPAYYGPPPPPYGARETVWVYGRHGMRFQVLEDRVGPDGCTLAESPVYLPDGRVDQRFVRVCPDRRGRYHIVD